MTISNLPAFFDMIYTDKDGRLAPDGFLYNDQTFQTLNNLVTLYNKMVSTVISMNSALDAIGITRFPAYTGINPPSLTTDQINAIVAFVTPDPEVPLGTMFYNNQLNKLQFKVATGTVETITSI